MKAATDAVRDLLATRQYQMAELFHFSLTGGGGLYYTSGDVNIAWGGQTYSCGGSAGVGPYLDRPDNKLKCHWKAGVEVDTLQFDVIPGSSTIDGTPFLSAVRLGVFDGAELTVSDAYWPQQAYRDPVTPTGTVDKFVGRVAEVDCGRSLATFSVNSHLELLNLNMPRNLWQAACVNTLYDASCTLIQSRFATTTAALAGSNAGNILLPLGIGTGYFDLGIVTFTAGANAGVSRTVKSYTKVPGYAASVTLISPFPSVPAAGDALTIYPGCNKSMAQCLSKFSNLANFRGAPFVPETATAV